MAYQIEWRNGTAAQWTSVNPTLALGEKGVEIDTGQFKIGTGTTAWNSLAYKGTTGPTQTYSFRSFGDGSDGNVTISSGTTSLSRDMYYNNLILNGTGTLNTNGWRIFVKGYLDITAAQVGAIQWNGNAGGNALASTGGSIGAAQSGGTVAAINEGGAGGSGTTGNGGGGSAAPNNGNKNGGIGGASNAAGAGSSGSTGAAAGARSPAINNPFSRFETTFIYGVTLISGGPGGGGGPAGGGDGTNSGGGGGAGGNGGGLVALYINSIVKSSSTLAGTIQANGGNGGNGGNGTAGNTGGGSGGGGGGGGWVYISYNYIFGPTITGLIQANGGNGGNGGNGNGTGIGGSGGNAGTGGRVNIFNVPNNTSVNLIGGVDNTTLSSELNGTTPTANTASVTTPGGNGGFNGTLEVSL